MKIRYIIDNLLTPRITALDWVDRYGGIVRTVNLQVKGKGDKLEIKRYPVACDVTPKDCDNVKIQQDLVPNDAYKSVIYWEQVSPMANSGFTSTKDFYTKKFKGTARIVVWLNLAKLGVDNCKDGFLTLPSLEEALTIKGNNLPAPYDGFQFWVQPLKMVKQDINTVFGHYDYDKLKNYYLYPFDFYAIDVAFEMNQCLSKGGVFTPLPPIDCPNE